jgi:butyrate response factor 1
MRLSRNTAFSKIPCGPVIEIDKAKIASWSTSNSKYKTELCKYYVETGVCKFDGDCTFAHGAEDLRNANHKSVLCRLFHMTNNCPYGEILVFERFKLYIYILFFSLGQNCAFIHDEYRRSSIIVKPGYTYAPQYIPANGDQATIDEQEHRQRSRRSSSGYASVDDQLSI